jgi:ribonucleotide reductase alpha subunit
VAVVILAQEIIVGNSTYPTPRITENARNFRQLGLGYANLGALLMSLGIPYNSDAGRAYAAALTALMTGHAYATSARIAARMGPFAAYEQNREPMLPLPSSQFPEPGSCWRQPGRPGTRPSPWGRPTATATPRVPSSPLPAPSPS